MEGGEEHHFQKQPLCFKIEQGTSSTQANKPQQSKAFVSAQVSSVVKPESARRKKPLKDTADAIRQPGAWSLVNSFQRLRHFGRGLEKLALHRVFIILRFSCTSSSVMIRFRWCN